MSAAEPDLVSIIIPCYKQDRFLAEAIESALAQTYPRVEVVVVDDGCPGKTAGIAAFYNGVRLIRQANQGLAAARNAGFRASRGEYLVFLDADDRLLPHAVAAGLAELRAHPQCAFAFGICRNIAVDGSPLPTPSRPRMGPDAYDALLRQCCIAVMTVIYRRSILDTVGGFSTSSSIRGCEDYDMYLRVAATEPVRAYDEVIAEYRMHAASMSHNSAMMLTSTLAALRVQAARVRGHKRYENAYRTGIAVGRWYYGGHLANEIRSDLHAARWSACLLGLVALLRHHPLGLAEFAGRQRLRRLLRPALLGTLRRTKPLSDHWGCDRGTPVDRSYIEHFLGTHRGDIRGHVLELMDSRYTQLFGGGVTQADILDIDRGNPNATVVADLAVADSIPSNSFDTFILTQTLHLIFDVRAAIGHAHRILRPGGVLLCTVPVVSRINPGSLDSEYWRFTKASCQALFTERFGAEQVTLRVYGSVLTGIAFLAGIAAEELSPGELRADDESFPVLIGVRAVKR